MILVSLITHSVKCISLSCNKNCALDIILQCRCIILVEHYSRYLGCLKQRKIGRVENVPIFNNYSAKLHGISCDTYSQVG